MMIFLTLSSMFVGHGLLILSMRLLVLFTGVFRGGERRVPYIKSPPLTRKTCPVMYAAPGPARNATAAATSSGVPTRASGIAFSSSARRASGKLGRGHVGLDVAGRDRVDGDAARGVLARQRLGQADDAGLGRDVRRLPGRAHLADHRGDVDDPARVLAPSAAPAARRGVQLKVPVRLTSRVRCQSASLAPSISALTAMPALLTRMCSPPFAGDDLLDRRVDRRAIGDVEALR